MTRTRIITGILLLITLGYATVRYNVFKDVPWEMLPLYTLNKALAWTGLCLLVLTFSVRTLNKRGILSDVWISERKALGKTSFNILGLHAILTLLLFRTEYGVNFIWQNDTIRAEGIASILLGSGALGLLAWYSKQASGSQRPAFFRFAPRLLLLTAALHASLWGFSGWLSPLSWPGYMPPITMISAGIAIWGLWLIRK